jgi:hypothetical protein
VPTRCRPRRSGGRDFPAMSSGPSGIRLSHNLLRASLDLAHEPHRAQGGNARFHLQRDVTRESTAEGSAGAMANARIRTRLPTGARSSSAVPHPIQLELLFRATHRSVDYDDLVSSSRSHRGATVKGGGSAPTGRIHSLRANSATRWRRSRRFSRLRRTVFE